MRDVAGTLGRDGAHHDPLWRVEVTLTPLERDLLRTWEVRRLALVAHAGASSLDTTQSTSRLEHSLGVLALVVHFAPHDVLSRAAALLHDVGHPPFSHTVDGLPGLDHHGAGERRVVHLGPVLRRHGLDPADVVTAIRGDRPSALGGSSGAMGLDHLDSFARAGQAHGRTRELPSRTLARLRLVDGAVDTDPATAAHLTELVVAEARSHASEQNVVTTAVLRHLTAQLLAGSPSQRREEVAVMTDDELWAALLGDRRTREGALALRRDPSAWRVHPDDGGRAPVGAIGFVIPRLYLRLPLVDGAPMASGGTEAAVVARAGLPATPARYLVVRR